MAGATGKTKRNWYLVIGGILLIVFGFVVGLFPGITLMSITFIAGVGFIFAGILSIISYINSRGLPGITGWMILYGVLDIIVGAMFLIHPIATSAVIPWLIGTFVTAFGIVEIVQAVQFRKLPGSGWGWALFAGILDTIIGLMFFFWPPLLAFYIAVFCIVRGVTLAVVGAQGYEYMSLE